ncbi:helix-turn-helix domain-containing protein [Poriferisphaera sp. WC338]|uniref:helix-turn-helix domain-containing protein n=1 Tax=Poriferisphaera sp. WC338 TaxID=3425129 RepID=UPI003D814F66
MEKRPKYIDVTALASLLGLPKKWLLREAKAGRLPYIHAGRRLLFNPDTVEKALRLRTPIDDQEKV